MEKRKKPKFKRTDWNRKPRFNSRAKKIKWRKAYGRDSKIRLSRKGRTPSPSIGYRMPKASRGLIKGMKPILVKNLSDLKKIGKGEAGIISGKIGIKKKIVLANEVLKAKVALLNFDAQKFLDGVKKKAEEKKKAKEKVKKEEKKTEEKKTEAKKVEEKKVVEKKEESKKETEEKKENVK